MNRPPAYIFEGNEMGNYELLFMQSTHYSSIKPQC